MNNSEDLGQIVFDAVVDLGHKLIDRGYAQAWFSWIEWIGLTALVYVVAKRNGSNFLYIVSGVSAFILVIVGIAAVEKLRDWIMPSIKCGKVISIIIAGAIMILGVIAVQNILVELLPSIASK